MFYKHFLVLLLAQLWTLSTCQTSQAVSSQAAAAAASASSSGASAVPSDSAVVAGGSTGDVDVSQLQPMHRSLPASGVPQSAPPPPHQKYAMVRPASQSGYYQQNPGHQFGQYGHHHQSEQQQQSSYNLRAPLQSSSINALMNSLVAPLTRKFSRRSGKFGPMDMYGNGLQTSGSGSGSSGAGGANSFGSFDLSQLANMNTLNEMFAGAMQMTPAQQSSLINQFGSLMNAGSLGKSKTLFDLPKQLYKTLGDRLSGASEAAVSVTAPLKGTLMSTLKSFYSYIKPARSSTSSSLPSSANLNSNSQGPMPNSAGSASSADSGSSGIDLGSLGSSLFNFKRRTSEIQPYYHHPQQQQQQQMQSKQQQPNSGYNNLEQFLYQYAFPGNQPQQIGPQYQTVMDQGSQQPQQTSQQQPTAQSQQPQQPQSIKQQHYTGGNVAQTPYSSQYPVQSSQYSSNNQQPQKQQARPNSKQEMGVKQQTQQMAYYLRPENTVGDLYQQVNMAEAQQQQQQQLNGPSQQQTSSALYQKSKELFAKIARKRLGSGTNSQKQQSNSYPQTYQSYQQYIPQSQQSQSQSQQQHQQQQQSYYPTAQQLGLSSQTVSKINTKLGSLPSSYQQYYQQQQQQSQSQPQQQHQSQPPAPIGGWSQPAPSPMKQSKPSSSQLSSYYTQQPQFQYQQYQQQQQPQSHQQSQQQQQQPKYPTMQMSSTVQASTLAPVTSTSISVSMHHSSDIGNGEHLIPAGQDEEMTSMDHNGQSQGSSQSNVADGGQNGGGSQNSDGNGPALYYYDASMISRGGHSDQDSGDSSMMADDDSQDQSNGSKKKK